MVPWACNIKYKQTKGEAMKLHRMLVQRPLVALTALALVVGSAVPALLLSTAEAAGAQMLNRQIQMSDSSPSGNANFTTGIGSGTNVTYKIDFTSASPATIGGIVIDICSNTPIIGDATCTSPAGFNWGSATPTATVNGATLGGTWTASATVGDSVTRYPVLKLTNAVPVAPTGLVTITVTGVTNPTQGAVTGQSFYARVTTFATSAGMSTAYPATDLNRSSMTTMETNGLVDYGGVALSTTTPITVTAKVMETMMLCTSGTLMAATGCTDATSPSVNIGEDYNGTKILRDDAISTASAWSMISTNASTGYGIWLRGRNTCPEGGMTKVASTNVCEIPAAHSGAGVAGPLVIGRTTGNAAFGMRVGNGAFVGTGTGTNTAVEKWTGDDTINGTIVPNASNYLMDTTSGNDNINYVYGSQVVDSTQQANSVQNEYFFAATASPTTPAGIYTQTFSLIASGRF